MNFKKNKSEIEKNIKAHDNIAKKYEKLHGEIYNDYEQSRLRKELISAISYVKTESKIKTIIDYGCGAGNLTRHLSDLGCEVIACDISQGFLDLINSRNYKTKIKTVKLNGLDLSCIPDESVDMIATYSVLHHIPDYLSILNEFIRVIKSGGIIYIDHEFSEDYWSESKKYKEFELKIKNKSKINFKKYFILTNYYDWLFRKFINQRYHREGDIHVFKDDHIEWNEIKKILNTNGCKIMYHKNYLLYRRGYDHEIFEKYKNEINDMSLLIFRK